MSYFDDRQSSVTNGLQLPRLDNRHSLVEQLPFPESTPFPGRTTHQLEYDSSPDLTGALEPISSAGTTIDFSEYAMSPHITRILPDINTGALSFPPTGSTTTALRQPIVIRGSGKKKTQANHHPPKARKWVISVSAIALLLVITLGTAFAVSPLGSENGHFINPIQLVANLVHNGSNNPSLITQQAAGRVGSKFGSNHAVWRWRALSLRLWPMYFLGEYAVPCIEGILGSLAWGCLSMGIWCEDVRLDCFEHSYRAFDYCTATGGTRRQLFWACCCGRKD